MRADEAALLRSMVAIVRQRYGLDEIEAAAYVVDMPNRIKALEAENAALRLRVVPALEWTRFYLASKAQSGAVQCSVECFWMGIAEMRWGWQIKTGGQVIATADPKDRTLTREEAESACEAAFLRLVGCKNG